MSEATERISELVLIGCPYCPAFGAGAARSFCSRHDDGATGRWLT